MWTEKYRPHSLYDMIGNEYARRHIVSWIKEWKRGGKPLLIIGPPGTGKTTLVRALSKDFGYYVFELNASDLRTKEKLEPILSNISSINLYGQPVLVFLDEIDGIFSRGDQGGMDYINKYIEDSVTPVVMAANSKKDSMKEVYKKSTIIEFKRIPNREIELVLNYITDQEGINLSYDKIQTIVRESNGDMRYAINQIQSVGTELIFKDRKFTSEEAVKGAMYSRNLAEAVSFISRWDADPELKIMITAATLFNSGTKDMVKRAKWLSDADMLIHRIKKFQEWRMLKYLNVMIASTLNGLHGSYNEYFMPFTVINQRWKRPIYESITGKMMQELHVGKAEAALTMVPMYEFLIKRGIIVNDDFKKAMA
ncbi:MAG: AAA family ATPase [Conexivisphaerales archaeon]